MESTDPRPTIVQIAVRLDPANDTGGEPRALEICRVLDRRRYRVTLLCGGGSGPLQSEAARMADLDLRIIAPLDPGAGLLRQVQAYRVIRDHLLELDRDGGALIVHTHSGPGSLCGRLAALAVGVHRLVHTHRSPGMPAGPGGHPDPAPPARRGFLTSRIGRTLGRFADRRTPQLVECDPTGVLDPLELDRLYRRLLHAAEDQRSSSSR